MGDSYDQEESHGHAGPAQQTQPAVGVAHVAEQCRTQHGATALALHRGSPVEEIRSGQQPAFTRQRSELIERGQEPEQEEHRDAPLKHLAGELEIHGRDTVHDLHRRRVCVATTDPGDRGVDQVV